MEAHIHFVNWMLGNNFSLSVYIGGGEFELWRSKNKAKILEEIMAVHDCTVQVHKDCGKVLSVVHVITQDVDPDEQIANWREPENGVVNQWFDEYLADSGGW